MKKVLLAVMVFVSAIAFSDDEKREFRQPMEEKVFELKRDESKEVKIEEAFSLGRERIERLKQSERELLELEAAAGMDRTKEIKNLEEKYEEIYQKYSNLKSEKELLIFENESYEKQLKRFEEIERAIVK